jgi:hypothetical protein
MRRQAAQAGGLGVALVAAAVAVICCSGPGILGSGVALVAGSWVVGGAWLGGLAVLTAAAILLLRRRRTVCRRVEPQGEGRVPRST